MARQTALKRRPSTRRDTSAPVRQAQPVRLQDSARPMPGRQAPPLSPPAGVIDGFMGNIGGNAPSRDRRGPPNVFIQPYPGPGDRRGDPNVFIQPYPGVRPQPNLDQIARERAQAINQGGMVTMDYNPERERLVNQYLNEMRSQPVMAPPFINDMIPEEGNPYAPKAPTRGGGFLAPRPGYEAIQRDDLEEMDRLRRGIADGMGAGIGGVFNQPGTRAPAPMRPMGDGRDRRFPQPTIRPPAPLQEQYQPMTRPPAPMRQPYQPAVRPPAPLPAGFSEGMTGTLKDMFRRR